MELSLFDLHCDTAYEMHRRKVALEENGLAISLQKAQAFRQYIQVMALWTDRGLSDDEGWDAFLRMYAYLQADPAVKSGKAALGTRCPERADGVSLLLGIEDARILAGRLERVDIAYEMGVRFLTLLWGGETCIGGSHDTTAGLTPFGKQVAHRAAERGILLDISHASERAAEEILSIAAEHSAPVLATHSNAYVICPVSRNLRDEQIRAILKSSGLIGLNLYRKFIAPEREVKLERLLPHIEHFLSLGAEHALCLGGDMDGAWLPADLEDLAALPRLAELLLRHNYSEALVHAIFFDNAYHFARRYLI